MTPWWQQAGNSRISDFLYIQNIEDKRGGKLLSVFACKAHSKKKKELSARRSMLEPFSLFLL